MRTNEEIVKMEEGLGAERKKLPEFSAFGDANWQSIDEQLSILEKVRSGEWDEGDVEEAYEENMNKLDVDYTKYEHIDDILQWLKGDKPTEDIVG